MTSRRLWIGVLLLLLAVTAVFAVWIGSGDSDEGQSSAGRDPAPPAEGARKRAQVRLSPSIAPVGSRVVIRGRRFPAARQVRISFGAGALRGPRTSARGAFSKRIEVPSLPPGRYRVRAKVGSLVASARFTITGDSVVVAAAGDIACDDVCGQDGTARLVERISPDAVLGLGDFQYETGKLERFRRYYDPYWGRFKSKTYAINGGSHDFYGTGAYLDYFNDGGPVQLEPEGSYSFDIGRWHVVALNSYCFERSSCDEGHWTRWLRQDLKRNPTRCTLAFWHEPYWTSPSHHEPQRDLEPWARLLYEAGVDVLLQAHNHGYERFAPQKPDGAPDESFGIRAFTVGTGGHSHYEYHGTAKNSVTKDDKTYGVLELTLHDGDYRWRFVPEPGERFSDDGTGACHGAPS